MELILQGWLDTDDCGNIGLKYSRNDYSWNCKSPFLPDYGLFRLHENR